jgi:hypothetical protein
MEKDRGGSGGSALAYFWLMQKRLVFRCSEKATKTTQGYGRFHRREPHI